MKIHSDLRSIILLSPWIFSVASARAGCGTVLVGCVGEVAQAPLTMAGKALSSTAGNVAFVGDFDRGLELAQRAKDRPKPQM